MASGNERRGAGTSGVFPRRAGNGQCIHAIRRVLRSDGSARRSVVCYGQVDASEESATRRLRRQRCRVLDRSRRRRAPRVLGLGHAFDETEDDASAAMRLSSRHISASPSGTPTSVPMIRRRTRCTVPVAEPATTYVHAVIAQADSSMPRHRSTRSRRVRRLPPAVASRIRATDVQVRAAGRRKVRRRQRGVRQDRSGASARSTRASQSVPRSRWQADRRRPVPRRTPSVARCNSTSRAPHQVRRNASDTRRETRP